MIYRLSQVWRALLAWSVVVDFDAAAAILSPALMALFRRMRRSEQLHSLRVMRTLRARGHDQPELLIAALLHDCGKSRYPYSLIERSLVVVIKAIMPRQYAGWAAGEPEGWRRPFVIAVKHPAWSAEDMAGAGASGLAVKLARGHQDKFTGESASEEDRLLAALQAADDDS